MNTEMNLNRSEQWEDKHIGKSKKCLTKQHLILDLVSSKDNNPWWSWYYFQKLINVYPVGQKDLIRIPISNAWHMFAFMSQIK